jgi:hypothetical protein
MGIVMKRVYVALLLCVMFFGAVPAWGGQELPAVVGDIVRNKDFFAKEWALYGYEDCFINSAERLYDKRVGVILLAPSGFECSLVYDVEAMEVVYKDMSIPAKSRREDMRRESVSVADAVKLAKKAVEYQNSPVKK